MIRRWSVLAAVVALAATADGARAQEGAKASAAALKCTPQRENVAGRPSPYDSATVAMRGLDAKICYGRPSARGRTIFGADGASLVPFGKLWRTGANEPTIIHLSAAAEIAGIPVQPGSYSIYTVPGETEWTVIVNRSIGQWGHESQYTAEVQAREVGRARVKSEKLSGHVETFTITSAGSATPDIVLEWEKTRVRIPVVAGRS